MSECLPTGKDIVYVCGHACRHTKRNSDTLRRHLTKEQGMPAIPCHAHSYVRKCEGKQSVAAMCDNSQMTAASTSKYTARTQRCPSVVDGVLTVVEVMRKVVRE